MAEKVQVAEDVVVEGAEEVVVETTEENVVQESLEETHGVIIKPIEDLVSSKK
jgi:hypothetical protein